VNLRWQFRPSLKSLCNEKKWFHTPKITSFNFCSPLIYNLEITTWRQLQVGPVIPPGTRFPFCRLLRFAGLRCRSTSDNPSLSQSYITTDSQSACPYWCQAPIWDTRPIFSYSLSDYFKTVSGLLMWGVLSDEKSGLYFSVFAGHRRRSLSQI
jgi:hypothetical protein